MDVLGVWNLHCWVTHVLNGSDIEKLVLFLLSAVQKLLSTFQKLL